MQNNVKELTKKLLRALDNNYNVIDMPAVIEIVSLLEKVTITKEVLETTRIGRHVNELRRKTKNESLSKRAKELVKKWRNMILPESNGQLKTATTTTTTTIQQQQTLSTIPEESELKLINSKKRPLITKDSISPLPLEKRQKLNGQIQELDLSDTNSNSSFKDVFNHTTTIKLPQQRDVILVNSDSNSSTTIQDEQQQQLLPKLEQQLPKKRGRKKGSKNHKNLLDEAESSFTNKLAVSRCNSKVKTTQELIASLQNKNLNNNPNQQQTKQLKEDLNIRAAKLTERVSIIDQKLNTNSNRYRKKLNFNNNNNNNNNNVNNNEKIIESGSVINDKSIFNNDIIVLEDEENGGDSNGGDDDDDDDDDDNEEGGEDLTEKTDEKVEILSLSVEEALSQLPKIDKTLLLLEEEKCNNEPICICVLKESKSDFSIVEGEDDNNGGGGKEMERFVFVENENCPAKEYLKKKYKLNDTSDERINELHNNYIPNVNGNYGYGGNSNDNVKINDLYVNVVPNVNLETIPKNCLNKHKFTGENFQKYSISEMNKTEFNNDDNDNNDNDNCGENLRINNSDNKNVFCEWHQVLEQPSYNSEIFKILPYVIID